MGGIREPLRPGEAGLARRVLLLLRWGIGDLVISSPALRALREATPDAEIVALGAAPATQLLEVGDVVDRTVDVQNLGVEHIGDDSAPARRGVDRWLAREHERHGRFDVVVDSLHAATSVREALWEAGYWCVEGDQERQHERTRRGEGVVVGSNVAADAGWGIAVDEEAVPRITTRRRDEAWADDVASAWDEPPTAVVPVASHRLKQWPAERFGAVCASERASGRPVVIFAGPDAATARAVVSRLGRADRPEVIGAEHLLRQAALLGRCGACVSNDTGLLHVAAAMGVPVAGIFGPTSGRVLLPRQVPARALGRANDCPHRSDEVLQMPACWLEDRCLHGDPRSCVDRVSPASVTTGLARLRVVAAGAGV